MRIEIKKVHQKVRTTTVYVTHDQVEAMTLASRIVVLNAGRIEQIGTPMELYQRPVSLFVAEFLGSPRMNCVAGRVVSAGADWVDAEAAGERIRIARSGTGAAAGDAVTVGIRPEDLSLARESDGSAMRSDASATDAGRGGLLRGRVSLLERLGGEALVHVRLDGAVEQPVIAKIAGDAAVAHGERIALRVNLRACHLFDRTGKALGAPSQAHDSEAGARHPAARAAPP
jgi:multiple sugar transport system ATP-binding protein